MPRREDIGSLIAAELQRQSLLSPTRSVPAPTRQLAVEVADRYADCADAYDTQTELLNTSRRVVVELLDLVPGEVVLDVGCGTGLCFPYLEAGIGPTGRIVGIDQSPKMLATARDRCRQRGWNNVALVESPVETAEIPVVADAALFCATHDILQSRSALANVFAHLRPEGRCAAVGGKWASRWLPGLNALTAMAHRPYVSSFTGFGRPWSNLALFVHELRITEVAWGSGYFATGYTR